MTEMLRRPLGRTGLDVFAIGLGTEYLTGPREVAVRTIRMALDRGVNFFDVLMPMPDYRDVMGEAFRGRRQAALLTCHFGGIVERGQWGLSREPEVCLDYLEDWLRRLGTDYVDLLNITCVDKPDDYARVMAPGGVMDCAQRLKAEGKARFIGMSSHDTGVAVQAAHSGAYDVLIFGCNLNWPAAEVRAACLERGVGFAAMKPYAGGEFFHPPYNEFTTPVLALAYILAQPGVATVIPGAANEAQLQQALDYVTASAAERDYTKITANFAQRIKGTCTYCSHCLPCSAEIPIGEVMRAYRGLSWGLSYAKDMAAGMADLPGACTACGECLLRCPFGVDVPKAMAQAAKVFAPYRQG